VCDGVDFGPVVVVVGDGVCDEEAVVVTVDLCYLGVSIYSLDSGLDTKMR
jgi:hypothetical protein